MRGWRRHVKPIRHLSNHRIGCDIKRGLSSTVAQGPLYPRRKTDTPTSWIGNSVPQPDLTASLHSARNGAGDSDGSRGNGDADCSDHGGVAEGATLEVSTYAAPASPASH